MESKRAFAIGTDAERLPTANPGGADVEVTEHTGCFEDALSQTVVNETKSKDYDWGHNVEEVGDKFSHAEIIRQDVERGVVTVDNDYEDASCHDPALLLLDNLPKFEPLIKPNPETNVFTLGGFLGNNATTVDTATTISLFSHEALYNMSLIYQSHIRKCAEEICDDQRIVMDSVKSVDAYCAEIAQSMVNRQLQTKTVSEQLIVVNGMMKQVEKTHKLLYETFQTLQKLDRLLPEGLGLDNQSQTQWPLVGKLFQNAKKKPLAKGAFQFESRRLSLQQKRTIPSAVTINFDSVLSSKHQESSDTLTFTSPVGSPDRISVLSMPDLSTSSTDNTASDRLKEIFISTKPKSRTEGQTSWLSTSFGFSPFKESLKRISTSVGTDSLLGSSNSRTPQNYGSTSSTIPLTSLPAQNLKSPVSIGGAKSTSSSTSLLTAMLKRSASMRDLDANKKLTGRRKDISVPKDNKNELGNPSELDGLTIAHDFTSDTNNLINGKQYL